MTISIDLSPKQARFAVAYAQHHNGSLAAREAGYSARCASVTSTRLLVNDSVVGYVKALEAEAAVALGVNRQRMLDELQEAAILWWSSYFGQFDKFFSCRLMLESNG